MENKIICKKCGTENDFSAIYCTKCKEKLTQNENDQSNTNNGEMINNQADSVPSSEGNILGIISLLFFFGGSTLVTILSSLLISDLAVKFSALGGLSPIIGIVLMIIGRIKYPNNSLLKVVMWIIIICTIAAIVGFVLITMWCYAHAGEISRGCE